MDDSRLFTVGFDDEPQVSPPVQEKRKTKRKRLRKADQSTSSQAVPQSTEQPEPAQEIEPVQQVSPQQPSHADILMDQFFSDQQPHFFSAEEMAAHQSDLARQLQRISLKDPAHDMLERAGCPATRIWSTSVDLNDFTLPELPVEEAEECIALSALKMGIYSLKLREARLAKERGLIVAKEEAEHSLSSAVRVAETDRQVAAEIRAKLESELGELRVRVASLQAYLAAAESAQVKFSESASQIPDGPPEITVDLSTVRENFKTSAEFRAYALEQLPDVFGEHLVKLTGEERQKEGVRVFDQHLVTKEWAEVFAREVYSSGCQHMLKPLLPLLEKQLVRPAQPSDFPGLHPHHLNALSAQIKKCRRALGMEIVQA
ncbi:unnamed protein product, partial [Cuscuta epithymum]